MFQNVSDRNETTKGNLRRRSSVARSIRRSQSGPAGITFEQQLLASIQGNETITTEEKIEKLISLSMKETLKFLQQENEQMEMGSDSAADDTRGDMIDNLVTRLGRQPLLMEKNIKRLASQTNDFKKDKKETNLQSRLKENQTEQIFSTRLRILKQYQDSLEKEINEWDELLQQRKNKYNFARLEYQEVSKGEQKITNKHKAQLPRLEDAWLRGLSDGRAELNRLEKQEVMMTLCAKQMLQKMAKKRKLLQDKSAELDQIAKRVCDTAANNLNAFEAYMSDKSVTISNNKDEHIKISDATESNFAKEVKEWFLEMQNT